MVEITPELSRLADSLNGNAARPAGRYPGRARPCVATVREDQPEAVPAEAPPEARKSSDAAVCPSAPPVAPGPWQARAATAGNPFRAPLYSPGTAGPRHFQGLSVH